MFSSYYMSVTGHVSPNKTHETDVSVVVISPEDREQVERLATAFLEADAPLHKGRPCYSSTCLADRTQAALRSLLAPPKPDEPKGLGAVVEDAGGVLWIMHGGPTDGLDWYCPSENTRGSWSAIAAVKVLSPGVQP